MNGVDEHGVGGLAPLKRGPNSCFRPDGGRKRKFDTRGRAEWAAEKVTERAVPMEAYKCGTCDGWHIARVKTAKGTT